MKYRELSKEEYLRVTSDLIASMESFEPKPYDLGDGAATIGYGYTFNRNENLANWEKAGISLTREEKEALKKIDDEPSNSKRKELGLAFTRNLTQTEARALLESASISKYEGPANQLNMPYSIERAAVVAMTYNRGEAKVNENMQAFQDAIKAGDRAEAWYELRYQSWGSKSEYEKGLRKGRTMEAQVFGLYDDPANISMSEAESAYRMLQKHRDDIQRIEGRWGSDLNGAMADKNNNVVAMANKDYGRLTATHGSAPTIREALEPAKVQYLNQLRVQFPEQSAQLTDRAFFTGAIYVAPPSADNPSDPSQLSIDENKLALRQGDRGPEVQALQEQLAKLGYSNAKNQSLVPDADFGPSTAHALSAFQKDHPTPNAVAGVADVATQEALREQVQASSRNQSNAPGQEQKETTPDDPRHPDNPRHELYNQLHDRIPEASERRLLQFTAACHAQGITGRNLGDIQFNEAKGVIAFASTSFPRQMTAVDLHAPMPTPEQAVHQIQQQEQYMSQVDERILTQNAQRAAAQVQHGPMLGG